MFCRLDRRGASRLLGCTRCGGMCHVDFKIKFMKHTTAEANRRLATQKIFHLT
jgi:hypothetical protein